MGNIAIENRINKLQKLEAQIEALKAEADEIRNEIKADMDAKGVDELRTKNFVVRLGALLGCTFGCTFGCIPATLFP